MMLGPEQKKSETVADPETAVGAIGLFEEDVALRN